MPIRRNDPTTSTVTSGTRRQAGAAKLPAAELKKLLAELEAAPPEQRAALLEGVAARGLALSEEQAKALNEAATKHGVAVSFGQPSAPATAAETKGMVTTNLAEAGVTVTQAQREEIAKQTALKAIDVATKFKDVAGEAEAINGEGDPRVSARRSAMSLLISEKSTKFVDLEKVKGLGGRLADDIAWLMDAERKDYTQQGQGQFSWNRAEGYGGKDYIQTEFTARVKRAETKAASFETGQSKIVDAGDNSVLAAVNIKDPDKRAAALADMLFQFRARVDTAGTRIDYQNNRIDRVGTVLVAEQRMLAAAADLDANDPTKMRELALVSAVIASHPTSSVNSIFDARNTVAEMARLYPSFVKKGDESAYEAIHHNFSRDTPRHITNFITDTMFPAGDPKQRADTFTGLVAAMESARNGDVAGARAEVDRLLKKNPTLEGFGELATADNAQFADKLRDAIAGKCKESLTKEVEQFLSLSAHLYRVVVDSRPSAETLQKDLFRAGDAWGEVADVIAQLTSGNTLGALRDLGEARLAMRDAIIGAKTGYERIELIKLDSQINRLTNEELGAAVDRVGNVKTDAERAECLLAVQTGLRSAVAMGLEHVYDKNDPAAKACESLSAVLKDVDAAMTSGKIDEDAYRNLMSRAYVACAAVTQNSRSFFDARKPALAAAGIKLDPEFQDQLAKESPLHYVTALSQKGMSVGLKEKISARAIENVEGMRVLNGIGPVVFSSLVFAESAKELAKLGTSKDQLAVLFKLEEKKMVAVGGLFVDSANAPGGNSHLNMYAMNNGIPVAALPELRTKYAEFFKTAANEGGVYIDDTNGFRMMTLQKAVEDGLVPGARVGDPKSIEDAIEKLRPGVNRSVKYIKPTTEGQSFELAAKHEAIINEKRKTREVELFIPQDEVRGVSHTPSFAELAKLGIHARHLAGEKGTVLALLSEHPVLGKHVPKGSEVTPADIRDALKGAVDPKSGKSLDELWTAVWAQDPKVGTVNADGTKETNPNHFLNSAFYTDRAYRAATRENLQRATIEGLTAHWVKDLPEVKHTVAAGDTVQTLAVKYNTTVEAIREHNGIKKGDPLPAELRIIPQELTEAGKKLYDGLNANPALAGSDNWITRSSFTGEDRPGKSGAGQYESFPNLRNPVARMIGVAGVVESTWMPEPIENNVAEQFYLPFIGPTVVVQHCLAPDISGVMISRDIENGARGDVTFQLVHGFGGGVEGGKTTEGVIHQGKHEVKITNGEEGGKEVDVMGIKVTDADMQKLREIVLETEKYFNEVIEKDKGHAVDMEVARVNGEWQIVQARVILMDK